MDYRLVEILVYAAIPPVGLALMLALAWMVRSVRRPGTLQVRELLRQFRAAVLVTVLCVLVGSGLSVRYAMQAQQAILDDANKRFKQQVELLDGNIQDQVAGLSQMLHAVRGLFLTRSNPTREDFRNFVLNSELRRGYIGARGLGFIGRVKREDLPAFIAQQRRSGWTDFDVKTSGDRADLYVVKALEPADLNQGAIGLDIGYEPRRREAADAAMRTGTEVISARVALIQDGRKRPAFLFLVPMYASAEVPADEAARVRELRGWAYAPLVFSELMASGQAATSAQTNFQLYDSAQLDAESLIYDSEMPSGEVDAPESLTRHKASVFSLVRPVLIADRVFYLRANSTPDFESDLHLEEPLRGALLGSGLSVLLATVLWLLMVGRARAILLAQGLTQDLDRLAMVVRRTSDAVYFADTEWRITWVNEGFTRMTGFTAEDALGLRPSQLLHSPKEDPNKPAIIDRLVESGERTKIRVMQRNKQGQDYWIDLEIMPVLDDKGRITSYLSVQSDITEQVQAKAALQLEKERAENILSGTNVGTWESNLQTGEQRWNERWGAMMGFTHDEVVPDADTFWQQRLHPLDQARINHAMADCILGDNDGYSCDVRVQRKDGSWMWILSRAKVMSRSPDGRAEWIGGIHTDITEIKQVEMSLRDAEAFLDRAGRIANVGAWQLDLVTREMHFSPQTCAIHGLAADFQPTEEVALSFYPEPDRQRLREAMVKASLEGAPWDLTVEFRTAQGEHRWVRVFGEVVFGESGPARLVGAIQDVTRDHLAQQEVERSGALLRGAIEAIDEAFVLFDPQDRLVLCNDKYRALYALSADAIVEGMPFERIVRIGTERGQNADAVGREEEWIAERMALHRMGNSTSEQHLRDGRWLKVVERRMPDGHHVGFRIDVTELKLATAAAELTSAQRGEEQRRMQSILEGTQVGTWEWNVQTGESIYNEQYVQMLGYTQQELQLATHEHWSDLVHPDDLVVSRQRLEEHLIGSRPSYASELRMRHKQGHWVWVLSKGKLTSRSQDGKPLWVYGTHMDITERKLAEQQLAHTTAMLQSVLDSATAVGVIALGRDHRISVFNRGAENLLGFSAREVIDLQSPSIFFDSAEMGALRETLELIWGHAPDNREVFGHVMDIREEQEWTLVRKDGSRFKASLIFSPMRDAQGAHVGHLAMVYDNSKQKEYESSLRKATLLAEQSSTAKSQFLANMSHEIRTPMNAILGMLQLMRNTELSERQKDYTEKAAGAARSLLGLLNDILDFSKVEAGKMQLNPEPFVLEDLMADLSVILSANLGAKDVDLLFDIDPAIPHELVGDAMRLKQVLINLGGNAVKFTERGQVVIRWKLLMQNPGSVHIGFEVEDSGIGIAPENQSRIFDAFTQAEADTTRRFGGTGLGLVISTRLIRLMGGEIKLQSALNQGSTFSFALELATVAPVALPAMGDTHAHNAPAKHVLLVDDNPLALSISAAMLASLGWVVEQASSGAQAVAMLQARKQQGAPVLDALFVDSQMPGMSGWETLRQARSVYSGPTVPRMVVMIRHNRESFDQGSDNHAALADGILVKPLTAAMFAKALTLAQHHGHPVSRVETTHPHRLAGMRVLLVEDNTINQQVAQELLRSEGAYVELADNGELGVAAVRQAQPGFDVVLMDLQMPVMDGLTATRVLRAEPRFAQLPIVAMTANAMESDRQECLAAGMNDHVGKPFDLNQLVETLLVQTRWVPSEHVSTEAADARKQQAHDAVWPAGMDVERALARMGGNADLLRRSLHAFAADARTLPQRLDHALAQADWKALKRELHSLKGLAATVGLDELSALAARAEKQVLADGTEPTFVKAREALSIRLTHVLQTLDAATARPASAPVQPVPGDEVRWTPQAVGQLRSLLEALQSSNMVSMELHAQLRQELTQEQAQVMADLDNAMAELDFEAAAAVCETLLQQLDNPATDDATP